MARGFDAAARRRVRFARQRNKQFNRCPRCAGTLIGDEFGAVKCLLCCRTLVEGKDDGRPMQAGGWTPGTSNLGFGRRPGLGTVGTNPISEQAEGDQR